MSQTEWFVLQYPGMYLCSVIVVIVALDYPAEISTHMSQIHAHTQVVAERDHFCGCECGWPTDF